MVFAYKKLPENILEKTQPPVNQVNLTEMLGSTADQTP